MAKIMEAIDAVATLAGVKDRSRFARLAYTEVVIVCRYWGARGIRPTNFDALIQAAEGVRAADDAIRVTGVDLEVLITHVAANHPIRDADLPPDMRMPDYVKTDWPMILQWLSVGLCAAAGINHRQNANRRAGTKRKRGKPRGVAKDWLLSNFVGQLARWARLCGGSLQGSRKTSEGGARGYGTLFGALELLRPHLPKGFLRVGAEQAIIDAARGTP